MPMMTAALEYGGYISLIKLIVYVGLFFASMPLVNWVHRDSQEVRAKVTRWTSVVIGATAVALLLWLVMPMFIIGLLVYLIAVGTASLVYVMHRNSRVAEFEKVLTAAHIKSVFVNENKKMTSASKGLSFITANGNEVPLPKPKSQNAFGFMTACNLFSDALWKRASEVILSPTGKGFSCVYRVDGMAVKQEDKTREETEYFIQFLKQVGDLDVEERRKPQRGSIKLFKEDDQTEWEVVTAGSTAGEQVILRRKEEYSLMKLNVLGLDPKHVEMLSAIRDIEEGLFIISGPKKSGVTSSFYTLLRSHDPFMNDINTLEKRPVVELDNITQNIFKLSDTGTSSYSQKLQSILRLGANIVGVADCEDKDCAKLSAIAASNGKVVHVAFEASSSAEALAKWFKLVPDRSLAVKKLIGVINQRLVRKLCEKCKQAYQPNPNLLRKFNMPADKIKLLYREGEIEYDKHGRPLLCDQCQGTGFVGRTAVFEAIIFGDKARAILKKVKTPQEIATLLRRAGMPYMQEQAIKKVATGETSIHEVIRVLTPPKAGAKPKK
ncbi:MAG: Flp pilus assembly complex ATPase component TadA [Planctomycetes bacterium]|nr:Flp pilus assembly complex ATPase component TadA [Planctomycetota bacterium]